jgi:hypothetical protein
MMKNKKTGILIFAKAAILFNSCNNSSSVATAKDHPTVIAADNISKPATIVGTWQWAGSANDENKNGMADESEWKYRDAAKEKEFAAMNISLGDLDVNFNADGTGFIGKTANDSTQFTWVANNSNGYFTTQNVAHKTKDQFYFGKNGDLIEKDTGEMKAAGQTVQQTTFEMYKKVK